MLPLGLLAIGDRCRAATGHEIRTSDYEAHRRRNWQHRFGSRTDRPGRNVRL